jgi:hypothetical protein
MEKNITKLSISMVLLVVLAMFTPGALAADADDPYTVTMNFIIPSDTAFSVALAGAEITIDFNPATKDTKEVEPDSQDDANSTAIAVITNDGNVNLNFSINLTAAKPSWVTVHGSDTNTFASSTAFDTDELTDSGWNDTAPAGTTDVYLWANFTDAVGGTTERTFQVNGAESS